MLEVVAIKYNDTAPVFPITRQLPEQGGSIGRADENSIVLPDPMRLLSRRHLLIEPEATGSYRLTNISSSNPAQINDLPLSSGESCSLQHGDRICIGSYLLEVRITAQSIPKSSINLNPKAPYLSDKSQAADINAILEQGSAPSLITDDPLGIATISPQTNLADFAGDSGQLLAGLEQQKQSPLLSELTQDPLLQDSNPLLNEDVLDPLALFNGEEKSLGDLLSISADNNSLLGTAAPLLSNEQHTPFIQDNSNTVQPLAESSTEPLARTKQDENLLIPEEFSLTELLTGSSNHLQQEVSPAEIKPIEPLSLAENSAILQSSLKADAITVKATPAETPKQSDTETLTQLQMALLQGLNLKELPANRTLDAELMRTLGAFLRTTVDGTLKLIAARATIKREVRANVTVIAPERNNPLKFSPDADVALQYLLGRNYPGFMGAQEAIDEAFADLLSHQLGVVSGMRSALSLVLERFDPKTITNNANTRGLIDSLLAMGRKARLWDAYKRYFENTREQAVDRFQEFFGTAFVEAYEQYAKAQDKQQNEAI